VAAFAGTEKDRSLSAKADTQPEATERRIHSLIPSASHWSKVDTGYNVSLAVREYPVARVAFA
jgi:hypothetical protein